MRATEHQMGSNNFKTRRAFRCLRRRGVTSLIAMLYLVLMATLAVGFYAVTMTTAQVSNNDERSARAQFAADSGMDFIRYYMGSIIIPSNTSSAQLFNALYTQLGTQINNTQNMPGSAPTISLSADGQTIYIPASNKYIKLDSSSSFRIELHKVGNGATVQAFVYGQYQTSDLTSARCIRLDFNNQSQPAPILDFGLATKGTISLSSTAHVSANAATLSLGSVLSTNSALKPITMSSGIISGDVSIATAGGTINWSGSPQVAGLGPAAWNGPPAHVHTGVTAPDFPSIDTSMYENYLNTHSPTIITGSPTGSTFTNLLIKANANPTFPSGSTVQGVVVVELPNKVSFSGSATLQGVIVAANSAGGATALNTNNAITFSGSVSASDVSSLDSSFADLKALGGGAIILAPTFNVSFSGSTNSLGGTIAGSKLTMSGSSGGNVTGSVMIMDNQATVFSGSAGITIAGKGTSNGITGMRFKSYYVSKPDSYDEVMP
jgi:hypothetical protein